jgi:hypothetical protein
MTRNRDSCAEREIIKHVELNGNILGDNFRTAKNI